MRINTQGPKAERIQTREPAAPAPAEVPSGPAPDEARFQSAFEEAPRRLPVRASPRASSQASSLTKSGGDLPPNIGSALPGGQGTQTFWNEGAVNLVDQKALEQGGITQEQIDGNGDLARGALDPTGKADPKGPRRSFTAADLSALVTRSGVPPEKQDAAQLRAAASYINAAPDLGTQGERLRKALDNFDALAKNGMPQLTQQEMKDVMWGAARVPGHALNNMSTEEMAQTFQDVAGALTRPGQNVLAIGEHKLSLTVDPRYQVTSSETSKPSFLSRVGGWARQGLLTGLRGLGTLLGHPQIGGTPYPSSRSQLTARAEQIQTEVARMKLTPDQQAVLGDLAAQGVSPVDIWHGSHVVLQGDGGALYNRWLRMGAVPRDNSSHYPGVNTTQYEIRFGQHGLLFGRDAQGNTWCQMENTAQSAGGGGHLGDTIRYGLSGQNVGPLGFSPHTDRDPVRVRYQQPAIKALPR